MNNIILFFSLDSFYFYKNILIIFKEIKWDVNYAITQKHKKKKLH